MKTPRLVFVLVGLKLSVFVAAVGLELFGHLSTAMTGIVMTVVGSLGLTSAIHSFRAPTSNTDALNELLSAGTTFLTQYLSSVMGGGNYGVGNFPPAAPPGAGGPPPLVTPPPATPTVPAPPLPPDPAASARGEVTRTVHVPPLRGFGARTFFPSGLATLVMLVLLAFGVVTCVGCNAAQRSALQRNVAVAKADLAKLIPIEKVLCLIGTHVPGLPSDDHAKLLGACNVADDVAAGAGFLLSKLDDLALSTAKPPPAPATGASP